MSLKPTNWGKIRKYPQTEECFRARFDKVDETISRLEQSLLKGQPCDKYGYLLKVGDMTNHGVVEKIETGYIITEQGKFHWSYLRKE